MKVGRSSFTIFGAALLLCITSGCRTIPVVAGPPQTGRPRIHATTESQLVVAVLLEKELRTATLVDTEKTQLVGPKSRLLPIAVTPSSMQTVDRETQFDVSLRDAEELKRGTYVLTFVLLVDGRSVTHTIPFEITRKSLTVLDYIGVHD